MIYLNLKNGSKLSLCSKHYEGTHDSPKIVIYDAPGDNFADAVENLKETYFSFSFSFQHPQNSLSFTELNEYKK
ncbi:MAG: hypothetical protein ACRC5C_03360 [Bacilli bacterium]